MPHLRIMRSCWKFMLIWLPLILAALALSVFAAGRIGLFKGSVPDDLGVREGRLKPPSATENSVSSQAGLYPDHPQLDYASIEPIALQDGDSDGSQTLAAIEEVISTIEGAEVVIHDDGYLQAQFMSKALKFIDDAEFWFDAEQQVIQVRSAARLGRKDFGMNRKHIEAVRTALGQR